MVAWLLVLQRDSEKYVLLIKILKYEQRSSASMCHTSVKLITCCEAEGRRRHIALTITKQCAGAQWFLRWPRGARHSSHCLATEPPLTLPWYQFSLIMNVLCWCHSSHLLRQEISISVVQCHWNRMNNGPRSWNISPRTKTEIAYMVVLACAKENLWIPLAWRDHH